MHENKKGRPAHMVDREECPVCHGKAEAGPDGPEFREARDGTPVPDGRQPQQLVDCLCGHRVCEACVLACDLCLEDFCRECMPKDLALCATCDRRLTESEANRDALIAELRASIGDSPAFWAINLALVRAPQIAFSVELSDAYMAERRRQLAEKAGAAIADPVAREAIVGRLMRLPLAAFMYEH